MIKILLMLLLVLPAYSLEDSKVRLFILSGQSNMVRMNPDHTFIPALQNMFPNDRIIVVKYARGGQPVRKWYDKGVPQRFYGNMVKKVDLALKGIVPDSVTFVWMQGESDAQSNSYDGYEDNLVGLIGQLRGDYGMGVGVVIGRISDYNNGQTGWDYVRYVQKKVVSEDSSAILVDTDDLNGNNDGLHFPKEGYRELGNRFANVSYMLLQ